MAFQYDFAKDSTDISWRGLENEAVRLLYSLVHRRESARGRPIIFICYSFGAFILKKVRMAHQAIQILYLLCKGTFDR